MEFLVQTYSKLKHGISHVELQQTVSDLVRYLIEKEDEQKEEKKPVKVRVERPYKLTPYEEELKDRATELVRPALERMQREKIEREVERKWQEARYGLKEQPQDMESSMKDSRLGVGLASIPPAIPQSLHLPTEYIQDFALHVAHCSNCRDLVERHLQYPFRMPVEDANGKHS